MTFSYWVLKEPCSDTDCGPFDADWYQLGAAPTQIFGLIFGLG